MFSQRLGFHLPPAFFFHLVLSSPALRFNAQLHCPPRRSPASQPFPFHSAHCCQSILPHLTPLLRIPLDLLAVSQIPQTANQTLHNLFQTNLSPSFVFAPHIFLYNLTSTFPVTMDNLQNRKMYIELFTLSTVEPCPALPSARNKVPHFLNAPNPCQMTFNTHFPVVLQTNSSCVDQADGMGPFSCG